MALELDDIRAGADAGARLLKLGAADSTDPAIQQLLAQLQLKGWLDADKVETLIADKKAKAAQEQERLLAEQKAAAEQAAAKAKADAERYKAEHPTLDPASNFRAGTYEGKIKMGKTFYNGVDQSCVGLSLAKLFVSNPKIQIAFDSDGKNVFIVDASGKSAEKTELKIVSTNVFLLTRDDPDQPTVKKSHYDFAYTFVSPGKCDYSMKSSFSDNLGNYFKDESGGLLLLKEKK